MISFKTFLNEMGTYYSTLPKSSRSKEVSTPITYKDPTHIRKELGKLVSTYKPTGHKIYEWKPPRPGELYRGYSALNRDTHMIDKEVNGRLSPTDEFGNPTRKKILTGLNLAGRFKEEGATPFGADHFYHHLLTHHHLDELHSDAVSPGGWDTWVRLSKLAKEKGDIEIIAHDTATWKQKKVGILTKPSEFHATYGLDSPYNPKLNIVLIARRKESGPKVSNEGN